MEESILDDKTIFESIGKLAEFDLGDLGGKKYLPMHPWQLKNILQNEDLDKSLILSQRIGHHDFEVQSSMRTLYNENAPYILKFSMDLTLTNSVRHLQVDEAIRGSQIESVLRKENIAAKYEDFTVLYEPFCIGLKSKQNKVLENTIVQLRENIKSEHDLENTFLLASLCEINPITNTSKLDDLLEHIKKNHKCSLKLAQRIWFQSFLEKVVDPFFKLACNDGVLLGAHMQNIIIETKDGQVLKTIFRDCQGTGFTEEGYKKYSKKFNFIKK